MNYFYFVVALVLGAGLMWVCVSKWIATKRAVDPKARLARHHESRLLSACSGNEAAAQRLIEDERRRRPGISRSDAAKHACARIKRRSGNQWTDHHR
jgi:hypothetical protein